MNSSSKLRDATHWLQDNLTFDLDQRVHVFEVTIRVLGMSGTQYAALCQAVIQRSPSTMLSVCDIFYQYSIDAVRISFIVSCCMAAQLQGGTVCQLALLAGGLLSSHIMSQRSLSAVPGYDGALLRLAVDLGNRLLPAFDTRSGIPLSWVHLRKVGAGGAAACLLLLTCFTYLCSQPCMLSTCRTESALQMCCTSAADVAMCRICLAACAV